MVSLTLARRYARALADVVAGEKLPVAQRRQEAHKVRQQLSGFVALLRQAPELHTVLISPAVPREKKLALLDKLRPMLGLAQAARNFLAVLLDHRRLDLLEAVLAAFDREVYARLGIVPVEITTAITLNENQKKLLEQKWAALAAAQVEMRYREDPALLGGATARLGSTIYDGSLRAQLRRLQQLLTAEPR